MPEYIVDCDHVPYGEGMTLVLPISINGHVHEQLIRCRDCDHSDRFYPFWCHAWNAPTFNPDGFCNRAKPRTDYGNPT